MLREVTAHTSSDFRYQGPVSSTGAPNSLPLCDAQEQKGLAEASRGCFLVFRVETIIFVRTRQIFQDYFKYFLDLWHGGSSGKNVPVHVCLGR